MIRLKHHVFLFLGKDLQECAIKVRQNVLKDGDDELNRHFSALSWVLTESGDAEVKSMERLPADEKRFYPDETYLFMAGPVMQTTITKEEDKEQITAFFDGWFRTHVTADTAGADARYQLTIVMQSSDKAMSEQALMIADTLNSPRFRYDVDLLLLAPDTYRIFVTDEERLEDLDKSIARLNAEAKEVTKALIETRPNIGCLQQIILLQNTKKSGASYNFDLDTIARIISEYGVTCVENYQDIYTQAVALKERNQGNIIGLGLACLDFDRYYFVDYLLHQAYLYIMEREGVQQTDVDINRASKLAKDSLEGRTQVLTNFYEKYVQPELDKGRKGEDIVPELKPHLDEFMADLEKAITCHITDESLSLPEKLAVIAQVLIIDEDSLSGNIYDKNQPAFIDLFREPINYFLDYYNESLEFERDEDDNVVCDKDTGIPVIKNGIITAPQNQEGYIFAPIDEIKRLRMEIRQCSEYIRSQTEQLEQLEKIREETHKAEKVVIDDDNYFQRFKLIGEEIKENPLADNYEPKPTQEVNIDLSHDFTPIKNQGAVGACTTFAVTAVYESILKKNDREDHDLSERFLYYNAREDDNRLNEEGVAISTAILSIHGKGICQEAKCLYSETDYNQRPSEEAYKDAENRKIKTAMNIVLGNDQDKNRDTLRSAVAEGYPVVISLRLFDAFDHIGSDGMVPVPSKEDKPLQREQREDGAPSYHAMVICGYDDKNEVFLVRNSWGERFGKKGYCFIPYAYMCDREFLNCAYIITEVTDDSIKVRGVKGGYKVMLDMTDINVKIAIIKNTITIKKRLQEKLIETYNAVYGQYETLLQTLGDPAVREIIIGGTKEHYENKISIQRKHIEEVTAEKNQTLKEHDAQTTRTLLYGWISVALSTITLATLSFLFFYFGIITIISAVVIFLMIIGLIFYARNRKQERSDLEANYDGRIVNLNRTLGQLRDTISELDYHSFVAGMVLDATNRLHLNLQSLRNSMRSYVNNLSVWYDEEKEKILQMSPDKKAPFISLLDNATLNKYFAEHCEDLTGQLRLYRCWEEGHYEIDEEKILEFKTGLKNEVKKLLTKAYEGFCIYDYVAGIRQYDFLADGQNDTRPERLKTLGDYSEMLLKPINTNFELPQHFIYVRCEETLANEWFSLCGKHTKGGKPHCGYITSPYKLLAMQEEYVSLDNVAIFI